MGRKVAENHKIMEQTNQEIAEELVQQQNTEEDFVLGEREEETQEKESQQKEKQQETDMDSGMDQELENSVETRENMKEQDNLEESQKKEAFEGTVVLTGAATYLDSGIRYFKNKPAKVTDQRVYEQLLKTGLFVHL